MQTKNKRGKDIWVPVEVNIDAHVSESTEFTDTERAAPHFIEGYVSQLQNSPGMDPSRPLWHCHIVNGTSGIAASHMIIRVHHAFGDGTSLMSLLLACTRRLGSPDQLPSVPVASRKRKEKPRWFWSLILLLWNTIMDVLHFVFTMLWHRDSDSIIKGHSGVENAKKKIVYSVIDISDMITVKDAVKGVSSNLIDFTFSVDTIIYGCYLSTNLWKCPMALEICLLRFWHLVKDFVSSTLRRVIRLIWGCKTETEQIKLSTFTLLSTIIKVNFTVPNRV